MYIQHFRGYHTVIVGEGFDILKPHSPAARAFDGGWAIIVLQPDRTMSAPFKVRAQAKAKGEKLKASKKDDGSMKKRQKIAASNKGKGSHQTVPTPPATEPIVHEPEAAGEDDHAFFDDEENAGYANFMLSLDSSELKTFSKRAKDRVAVPPTSKKKSKQPKPQPAASTLSRDAAPALETTSAAGAAVSDSSPAQPDAPSTETSEAPPSAAARTRKEAVVDAKRRKASTAGWGVDESGPERLPIKTRRGELKPNERMQSQAPVASADEIAVADAAVGRDEANESAAVSTAGKKAEENGDGAGDEPGHAYMMPDGEVYDSADSDMEDYSMGEYDGNGAVSTPASDGTGGSKMDLAVLRQRRFAQKKALMAELCEGILGAPEESLMRPKGLAKGEDDRSRMEKLFALVRFVASTLAVFVFDLPGWKGCQV